jgi:hypothetical protein
MTHMHASASSEGKLATGESQFMPLHLQMHPSMYSSPISILLEEMERERERDRASFPLMLQPVLLIWLPGDLNAQRLNERCISWSPPSVLQLHSTPFSSQSPIELTLSLHLYLTKSRFQTISFYLSKAWPYP